jgi:hypothetical protein
MYGRNDVDSIVPFNKHLLQFSDDHERFAGAYGPMVAGQWSYIVQCLKKDPQTRQAIMTIWKPVPGPSRDIPCTVAFQFLLRDDRLNMITTMRSNDIWLGMPYDIFTFTQLQAVLAEELEVQPGWYQHNVGSLHLYEQQRDVAKDALAYFYQDVSVTKQAIWENLSRTNDGIVIPRGLEAFLIMIAKETQDGGKFKIEDLTASLDTFGVHEDSDMASFMGALMGVPHGRLGRIRKEEGR